MSRISTKELAAVLTEKNGLSQKEAETFVSAAFDLLQEALEQEHIVKIKGLGTFKIIGVEARESVNVNTGERVLIEGHGKISFTPEATMKEIVNKPFSQFETVVLNDGIEFDDMKDTENSDIDNQEAASSSNDTQTEEVESVVENIGDTPASKTSDIDYDQPEIIKEQQEELQETITEGIDNIDDISTSDNTEQQTSAITETKQEAVAEEPDSSDNEDAVQVDSVEEDNENEKETSGGTKQWLLFGFVFIIFVVAAFGGGYFYAKQAVDKEGDVKAVDVKETAIASVDTVKKAGVKKDTVLQKNDNNVNDSAMSKQVRQAETVSVKEKNEVQNTTEAKGQETFDSSIYERMDNRVRTGAYRIVGTDHVVTVKKGDTLQRLSRKILGEGMSCYIEVYNGLASNAELKEGQKIKIPKLQLKKFKKK